MVLASLAASAMLLKLASAVVAGEQIAAFAGKTCDYSTGQFTYFSVGSGYPSCTVNYFAGTGFPQNGTDYEASFDFPDPGTDENGEACKYLVRAPSNVQNKYCGQVQTQVTKAFCAPLLIPDPFDLNFCCGGDCDAALQGKRDLEWVTVTDPMTVREKNKRDAYAKKMETMKRSELLRPRATSGSWSGSGATQDGPAQQVSETQNCAAGGSNSATIEVSTSSTQTWEVSASVSAGLFDIIEATLETSYSYAYTEEHSVSTTVSYTCQAGTSGYISFAPTLDCTTGEFSSDCNVDGNSCPTGQQTACAPVTNSAGLPLGTTNWVEII